MNLWRTFAILCSAVQVMAASAQKPNILWLIAEDFGPALSCYGRKDVHTPNLDKMAREGVRYSRFYTTAPVCSPSRSALMTGMYQTAIGAHNHRSHRDDGFQLPPGVKILPEWFRQAGYFTANIVELPAQLGFKGSGKTDWNFTPPPKQFDTRRWEDLKANQPFFAQINFHETHRKFNSPKKTDPAKVELPPYYPDHPIIREDYARYLDDALELDRKVGLVLDLLEKSGLADNTIVLFIGDHGESMIRGKQFCYEEGLHIPAIIRWPKNFSEPKHFKAGTVDDRLLEAIDFGPTFLALAGAPVPEKMQGRPFLGEKTGAPKQYVFGARDRCDMTVFRLRTVRDNRYRYIRNFTPERPFLQFNQYKQTQYPAWTLLPKLHAEGKLTPAQAALCAPTMPPEELYDLEKDPHQVNNLAGLAEHAEVLQRLRGVLEKWIADTDDQGRVLEPEELAKNQGVTKPGTPAGKGYTQEGGTYSGAPRPK